MPRIFHLLPEFEPFSADKGDSICRWTANIARRHSIQGGGLIVPPNSITELGKQDLVSFKANYTWDGIYAAYKQPVGQPSFLDPLAIDQPKQESYA